MKTMHKLQCLNLAKQFLGGCFKGTLASLAQKSYWRETVKDQLSISYKHFLNEKTHSDSEKHHNAEQFLDSILNQEMQSLSDSKQLIKHQNKEVAQKKEATRVIESNSRRVVHFVFDPCQHTKVTPFTRKFKLMLENDLDTFEREEHDKFEKYLENFVDETLDDNDHYPVIYERNDFYELELYTMNHISFSVADNPFFKLDTEKYYPEALVLSKDGTIIAHLGAGRPAQPLTACPSLKYKHSFRDERMRVNDDRKIEMQLSEFKEPGMQVIFLVRSYDLRSEKDMPEDTYDQAWFRLQNETTSQTLDYTKIKKLEVPEDY